MQVWLAPTQLDQKCTIHSTQESFQSTISKEESKGIAMSDSQEQEIGSKHSQQACHGALVLLGEVLLPQWTTCTITCHLINPFQYLISEGKKSCFIRFAYCIYGTIVQHNFVTPLTKQLDEWKRERKFLLKSSFQEGHAPFYMGFGGDCLFSGFRVCSNINFLLRNIWHPWKLIEYGPDPIWQDR